MPSPEKLVKSFGSMDAPVFHMDEGAMLKALGTPKKAKEGKDAF